MEFREHTHLPNHTFASKKFHAFARMGGPNSGVPDTILDPEKKEILSAKSFSTIPKGDAAFNITPISHRYFSALYSDKILVAITDGGVGSSSSTEAAERALIGFLDYMHSVQGSLETTRDAAHALQRSFSGAHNSICQVKESKTHGTSQLFGGLLVKLQEKAEHPWAFICCSVGHIKAFCRKKDGTLVDITQNNYLYRVSTPLGRLGPCLEGSFPDLTNLRLYYYPCEEDDILLFATMGIHANFHPQQLGKSPSHLNIQASEWKEIATNEKGKETLNKFICDGLNKVLAKNNEETKLSEMLTRLGNHVVNLTQPIRDFMEKNDVTPDKLNLETHPALLDHCTALTFPVRKFITMQQAKIQDLGIPASAINRHWKWHAFIPPKSGSSTFDFDVFEYLETCNPAMKQILEEQKYEEFEECYINVNDGDIEVRQEKPLVMQVWVRSKASPDLCVEKWDFAGEIDMQKNKPNSKAELGYSFSNLLRQREVDRRKVSEAVDSLLNLDTSKNVFVIKGKRRKIHFEQFGSAFKIMSGDMTITQAEIVINSVGGDSKGPHRFVQICSKKEASIANFIARFPHNDEWVTCSISEFLLPDEPVVESEK